MIYDIDGNEITAGSKNSIKEINALDDALRIASFNIYGAGFSKYNWRTIKKEIHDWGVDLCAMQEVRDPLGITSSGTISEIMTSDELPCTSTNGDMYTKNERSLLSRFPIASSYEEKFERYGSDHRYFAKYEVSLPKFKNRPGSENLKMSIYNTQLEVSGGGMSTKLAECQQMLDMMEADPNPFIVLCMDSNDASENKDTWLFFENAGYTRCIDITSKTVVHNGVTLDQIFINDNLRAIRYDVIDSRLYPWSNVLSGSFSSDHNLCFADIVPRYDKIYVIWEVLEHVTSSCKSPHVMRGDTFTATYTIDEGYELNAVSIWMIDENWHIENTVWDAATGTVTIPNVSNDVRIRIVATRIVHTGTYGVGVPSGYMTPLNLAYSKQCKMQLTINVPSWSNKTQIAVLEHAYHSIVMDQTTNTWIGLINTGVGTFTADKLPSQVVGQGKTTITFDFTNAGLSNSDWKLLSDRVAAVPMTIYELKILDANDTVIKDFLATDVAGIMKDVTNNKLYYFEDEDSLTVVE